MNIPKPPLQLSARELNALQRMIDMAWDHITQGPQEAKDRRSVWAANRALRKIEQYERSNNT